MLLKSVYLYFYSHNLSKAYTSLKYVIVIDLLFLEHYSTFSLFVFTNRKFGITLSIRKSPGFCFSPAVPCNLPRIFLVRRVLLQHSEIRKTIVQAKTRTVMYASVWFSASKCVIEIGRLRPESRRAPGWTFSYRFALILFFSGKCDEEFFPICWFVVNLAWRWWDTLYALLASFTPYNLTTRRHL